MFEAISLAQPRASVPGSSRPEPLLPLFLSLQFGRKLSAWGEAVADPTRFVCLIR